MRKDVYALIDRVRAPGNEDLKRALLFYQPTPALRDFAAPDDENDPYFRRNAKREHIVHLLDKEQSTRWNALIRNIAEKHSGATWSYLFLKAQELLRALEGEQS